jgi:hypothetical protein
MAAPAATSSARTSVVTVRFCEVGVVEVGVLDTELAAPGALEVVTPVEVVTVVVADDPESPAAFGVEPEHPARTTAATAPTASGQRLRAGTAAGTAPGPARRDVLGWR